VHPQGCIVAGAAVSRRTVRWSREEAAVLVNLTRWTGPLVAIATVLRASVAAWPFRSFDVA